MSSPLIRRRPPTPQMPLAPSTPQQQTTVPPAGTVSPRSIPDATAVPLPSRSERFPLSPTDLGQLLCLIAEGRESGLSNKPVFLQPPCLSKTTNTAKNLKLTQVEHALLPLLLKANSSSSDVLDERKHCTQCLQDTVAGPPRRTLAQHVRVRLTE